MADQMPENPFVTTGQFLALLYEKVLSRYGYVQNELFVSGRREGWLTELDEMSQNEPLSRRDAARILHEILRGVLHEAEEADWSAAARLADLYDCNRCVQHVAQVYAKGILTAMVTTAELPETAELPGTTEKSRMKQAAGISGTSLRFGGEELLSPEDAALAVERLLYPELRSLPREKENASLPGAGEQGGGGSARKIDRAEAERLLRSRDAALAVDVGRDTADFDASPRMQLSMMEILENPFLLEPYRDRLLLLYCNGGYQSEIAANCLLQHGYRNVFYFGLEE